MSRIQATTLSGPWSKLYNTYAEVGDLRWPPGHLFVPFDYGLVVNLVPTRQSGLLLGPEFDNPPLRSDFRDSSISRGSSQRLKVQFKVQSSSNYDLSIPREIFLVKVFLTHLVQRVNVTFNWCVVEPQEILMWRVWTKSIQEPQKGPSLTTLDETASEDDDLELAPMESSKSLHHPRYDFTKNVRHLELPFESRISNGD